MAKTDVLENLPEINLLEDEEITFETIVDEMIEDYEAKWEERTGEKLVLYPGDSRRIMLNVIAGKLYQLAVIINERHKLNFLQYMYGDFLKNWGANFGFTGDGMEAATVTLRFHVAEEQTMDIRIPVGTRATNGDGVYFATDEDLVIAAGQTYADTKATCTEQGTIGNGYKKGQINVITDPINLVENVENVTESGGGHDEYTDQELRELIYNFPDTYSTAGPEGCYEEFVKAYSNQIVDAKIITSNDAIVQIYVLLQNGELPEETYRENILEYMKDLKVTPDTDKVEILAPEISEYNLTATYYVSNEQKDIADGIKEAVEDAAVEFATYTKSKIGRAIKPDTLTSYAKAAGASRIDIKEPLYKAVSKNQVAICTGIDLMFGGLEEE